MVSICSTNKIILRGFSKTNTKEKSTKVLHFRSREHEQLFPELRDSHGRSPGMMSELCGQKLRESWRRVLAETSGHRAMIGMIRSLKAKPASFFSTHTSNALD